MPFVQSAGVRIHYSLHGQGDPLVLVHGYTAHEQTQWQLPGWIDFLAPKHRLLVVELRGHGRSGKPRGREDYSLALMAGDVLAMMDAAVIERADIFGYSMGSMVAMELLLKHGDRFNRAVLGGMGAVFPKDGKENCRDEEKGPIPPLRLSPLLLARTTFGFLRRYNGRALRAISKSVFEGKQPVDVNRLHEIRHPVLAISGTRDRFCPGTRLLAERIPNCTRVTLSGRGHVAAVRDPRFKSEVATFLTGTAVPPPPAPAKADLVTA